MTNVTRVFVFVDCVSSPLTHKNVNLNVFQLLKKNGIKNYVSQIMYIVSAGLYMIDLVDALAMTTAAPSCASTRIFEIEKSRTKYVQASIAFQIGLCVSTCKANDYIILITEEIEMAEVFKSQYGHFNRLFCIGASCRSTTGLDTSS